MSRSRTDAVPQPGNPIPAGSRPAHGGVNFCVHSRHAQRVELLPHAGANASDPSRVAVLDSLRTEPEPNGPPRVPVSAAMQRDRTSVPC
jgi:hypothetical protein